LVLVFINARTYFFPEIKAAEALESIIRRENLGSALKDGISLAGRVQSSEIASLISFNDSLILFVADARHYRPFPGG
jgi:hypothetical protein